MRVRPTGQWLVYFDETYWAAEHQTKRGLSAGADSWQELFFMMVDAEIAWDAVMEEPCAIEGCGHARSMHNPSAPCGDACKGQRTLESGALRPCWCSGFMPPVTDEQWAAISPGKEPPRDA